jgi:hypothetical protein
MVFDVSPPSPCPVIKLEAATLPLGPLDTWTNTGSIFGSFIVPTNATKPSVVLADSIRAVAFEATSGATDGAQLIGPEVPGGFISSRAGLTTNGTRTVEVWIRDSSPQSEKTILAWGRRGGFAPEGKNFSIGHGTNAASGAVDTGDPSSLGWADREVFGRWTYVVVIVSQVSVLSGTNYWVSNAVSAYVDGQLANLQTNALNTAAFAADAPNSSTDSTNHLHFRIGRQNTDTGEADGHGIGAFELARLRVYPAAMAAGLIKHRFDAERLQFLPPLRIDQVRVNPTNNSVDLSWAAGPGQSVSLEGSTDLAGWFLVASNLTGGGYTDSPTNPVPKQKYYRLRIP